jgi:hypothetical protein
VSVRGSAIHLQRHISPHFCIWTVIDCHQSWCGPCETMQAVYQQLFLAFDCIDQRLRIYNAEIERFKQQLQATLPEDTQVKLDSQGCMPLFLVVRVRASYKGESVLSVFTIVDAVQAGHGSDQGCERASSHSGCHLQHPRCYARRIRAHTEESTVLKRHEYSTRRVLSRCLSEPRHIKQSYIVYTTSRMLPFDCAVYTVLIPLWMSRRIQASARRAVLLLD